MFQRGGLSSHVNQSILTITFTLTCQHSILATLIKFGKCCIGENYLGQILQQMDIFGGK